MFRNANQKIVYDTEKSYYQHLTILFHLTWKSKG